MASSSPVPVYIIDLSRPPRERYNEVINDLRDEIKYLTPLFAQIVHEMGIPLGLTTWIARLLLRKVYDKEQTEELKGISTAAGVEMYLLVCFNTLLDLLMGCTSGGARVKMNEQGQTQMLHFRTLDWEMDPLRKVVVQLEYMRQPHGAIIARSITYAGFVGTLTGLRKGLSASLNFRPYHNDSHSTSANIRFNMHRLGVLLGMRPSIASSLRDLLLPRGEPQTLEDIEQTLPAVPSTAAYLTFSNGERTVVFEKDHVTATADSSTSFVTITNHDVMTKGNQGAELRDLPLLGMEDLIEDSEDRLACIANKWKAAAAASGDATAISKDELITWVDDWPTTNVETHYSAVMNAVTGEFEYIRKYNDPPVDPNQSSVKKTAAKKTAFEQGTAKKTAVQKSTAEKRV